MNTTYKIVISVEARKNLLILAATISIDYSSPLTSKKYIDGVRNTINSLKYGAESYSIQTKPFFVNMVLMCAKLLLKKCRLFM